MAKGESDMSKYKAGDKFIIEIGAKMMGAGVDKYIIKGFNTLVFDDNGLDRLERYDDGIKAGDILMHDTERSEEMIVTAVHGEYVSGVCIKGKVNEVGSTFFDKPKERWIPTGRNFDIESILKIIAEVE